jgi:hypothetical protein
MKVNTGDATKEMDASGTREMVELPDGARLEVRNSHRHVIDQTVTISAPDPEWDNQRVEVVVSGSVTTYEPRPRAPTISFGSHPDWTDKQWALVKRLADQALAEYQKRFLR